MTTAPDLRLDDQFCFALYAATNAVVRAYRPLLAELGLTYPQYLVMMVLWEHRDVSVQEIGRRLDLPPNGLAPIVRRLVGADLLTRSEDPTDGRAVRVRLTAHGSRLERAAVEAQAAVLCRTGLAPDEQESLRTALHELTRSTTAGPGVDAGRPAPWGVAL